jgi:hypothetical protein
MSEPEWFPPLRELVAKAGNEAHLFQLTEWQTRIDVIVSNTEVENMSFLVYRDKHGVLSLEAWRPVESGSELRVAIEEYLKGLNEKVPRFRSGINSVVLRQLDVLKHELGKVQYELSWVQVEDWRLELSFSCEGVPAGSGKVYFGNSGIRSHTLQNNKANEQFDQFVRKCLERVAPRQQDNL